MDKNFFEKSFKLKEDLVSSEVKEETILLDVKSGIYFKANNVGTFILKLLSEIQSFEELLKKITNEYDVAEASCKDELEIFLHDLLNKKLVEIL